MDKFSKAYTFLENLQFIIWASILSNAPIVIFGKSECRPTLRIQRYQDQSNSLMQYILIFDSRTC